MLDENVLLKTAFAKCLLISLHRLVNNELHGQR